MVDDPKMGQAGLAVSYRLLVAGAMASALVGCGNGGTSPTSTRQVSSLDGGTSRDSVPGGKDSNSAAMMKFDLNKHPMNKVVCDPFDTGNTTDPLMGVKASLHYKKASQPAWSSVQDYITNGQKSSRELFFSDLFVPTRMFDKGFATQSSEVVKDDAGNKLIEHFALKFETNLVLSPLDPEGDYELSMLSDDGAIVRVNIDGVWKTVINNDGTHPTRMGCSNTLVPMVRGVPRPIEISYYQGPRYHIAHVLMWKLSHQASVGKDAECGKEGNEYFFNPNNGSAPLAAYGRLYGRSWRPVHPENYMLSPGGQNYNPCTEGGVLPVISNFTVEEIRATDIVVSWETDIPTASQVLYQRTGSTEIKLTASDNLLGRSHRITVSGLNPGTEYKLQAVATGEDLGRTVGEAVTVRTFAPDL